MTHESIGKRRVKFFFEWLVIIIILILLTVWLVKGAEFTTDTQVEFDLGTYSNTFYNTTFVQLNITEGFTLGNYTSQIFDAGSVATWNNISWTQGHPYQQELPNNQGSESALGGANMLGNVLLFHFNEQSGSITDSSGEGNTGSVVGSITYNAEGKFNSSLGFDGEKQYVEVPYDASLNTTTNLTVEFWLNSTGASVPLGTINNTVIDSLEYDTVQGREPAVIHIGSDIYAIAYRGNGDDGFIATVNITENGSLSTSVIDSLEYDTSQGETPSLVRVGQDIYAIAYAGSGNDGFVATVNVTGDGQIGAVVIDSFEYDTSQGMEADIFAVSKDIFGIAYRGPGDDGFLVTVNVSQDGSIVNSVVDSFEFDTATGRDEDVIHIASDIFAIAYRGSGTDGFVVTVNVSQDGSIVNSVVDSFEFDTTQGEEVSMARVKGEIYAIAYRGNGNDGFVATLNITNDGSIGSSVIDTIEFDMQNGLESALIPVARDVFAVAYRGPGDDGHISTMQIAEDGQINNALISTFEYQTTEAREPSVIHIANDIFAVAYRDTNSDGFIATVDIVKNRGVFKDDSFMVDTNTTHVFGTINNNTVTTALANGWNHLVLTYDSAATSSQQKLYVNGQLNVSGTLTDTIFSSNRDVFVGRYVNSSLDELAIYNRTLSATEVLNHYKRGILHLNLSVRSCDDSACSGESFISKNNTSPQNLSVIDNQYFQYQMRFETDDGLYTTEVYDTNIDYSVSNSAPDTPVLNSPTNNSVITVNHTLLNTTVSDLDGDNLTVWFYGDGIIINTTSNIINGSSITFNWTTLLNGMHNWSVIASDGTLNTSSTVFFFTINETNGSQSNNAPNPPTLIAPANNSVITVNHTLLNATVDDDDGDNLTAWFYGDGGLLKRLNNITNGSSISFNWTNLTNGVHNWSVTSSDNITNASSQTWFFTVNETNTSSGDDDSGGGSGGGGGSNNGGNSAQGGSGPPGSGPGPGSGPSPGGDSGDSGSSNNGNSRSSSNAAPSGSQGSSESDSNAGGRITGRAVEDTTEVESKWWIFLLILLLGVFLLFVLRHRMYDMWNEQVQRVRVRRHHPIPQLRMQQKPQVQRRPVMQQKPTRIVQLDEDISESVKALVNKKTIIPVRERLEKLQQNKPNYQSLKRSQPRKEQKPQQPISKRAEEVKQSVADFLSVKPSKEVMIKEPVRREQVDLNRSKQPVKEEERNESPAKKINSLKKKKDVLDALKEVYK